MEIRYRGANSGSDARKWTPAYLTAAETDARKFLNDLQYEHAVQQILSLCEEDDPSHPVLSDVRAVDEFFELRDKYGVLGKINLRVFFALFREQRTLVVLGAWKKEQEDQTPVRIVKRMKWRKRQAQAVVAPSVDTKGVASSSNKG